MARGSRFSAVLTWFREAPPDEVRAIMPLVIEACAHRKLTINVSHTPQPRRARATKAEMAQRRLNGPDRVTNHEAEMAQ
jgi:hypothetical protein